MRLSDILLIREIRVETTSDAYRIIASERDRASYVGEYGDVEVEHDPEYDVFRVPAFRAAIDEYTELKAADCRRWGCE
jgi:hypothetical protein